MKSDTDAAIAVFWGCPERAGSRIGPVGVHAQPGQQQPRACALLLPAAAGPAATEERNSETGGKLKVRNVLFTQALLAVDHHRKGLRAAADGRRPTADVAVCDFRQKFRSLISVCCLEKD